MPEDRKFVAVMPGAEPYSAAGGPNGVLVVHGFTGTPQSMRGLADAFAAAGYAVELPLLPGHGTSVDDMEHFTFADWSDAAERAYEELAGRCEHVVVAGLSMGAMLATWLATRHPEIAGLVVVNGAFGPLEPNVREGLEQLVAQGVARIPGPGNDVAEPGQTELAYTESPPAQLLSLLVAVEALQDNLARVHCPSLVITSDQDHVVPPISSDHFAERVGGPVERMRLAKSFHVATLDYERAEIEAAAVASRDASLGATGKDTAVLKRFVGAALTLVVASWGLAPAVPAAVPAPPSFGPPVAVTIQGYNGDAMEPFVSPDGKYLFFNNRNDPATSTNLYYARRVNDTTFKYAGPIAGANSAGLDAVASMDSAGNLYFVSTRSYSRTLATIYRGTFANGRVAKVAIVPGVSKATPGWVNFDAAVNASGSTLYFVDGRFDGSGQPVTADLVIAKKTANGFARAPDSARLLAKVNTKDLEYAPAISTNGLTLYFTRATAPAGAGSPAIYVATRPSPTSAFGAATKLTTLTGFVEAPALSPDGRSLYFHRLVGDRFAIYHAFRR